VVGQPPVLAGADPGRNESFLDEIDRRLGQSLIVELSPPSRADIPLESGPIPSHAELNHIALLKKNAPQDLRGCVGYVTQSITQHLCLQEREQLIERQSRVLEGAAIMNKDDVCTLLTTVVFRDTLTGYAHGFAGALAFNLPGLSVDYPPLSEKFTLKNPIYSAAASGSAGGSIVAVADVHYGPVPASTWAESYNLRPHDDVLPENLRNLHPPSRVDNVKEIATAWVEGFAYAYGARAVVQLGTVLYGGPTLGAAADNPIAESFFTFGGQVRARFNRQRYDENAGRTGIPYFFARSDLAACVADAQGSGFSHWSGKIKPSVESYLGNVVTETKKLSGIKALRSRQALTSIVSLTAGLAVPPAAAAAVSGAFPAASKVGSLMASSTKFLTYEALWLLWGSLYGAVTPVVKRGF